MVRFAVLSDIHANLSALRAALRAIDAAEAPVDRIICAGDTVGRGPHPNEVLSLLRDRQIEVVLGNYDDAVSFDRIGSGVDFADEPAEAVDRQAIGWTRDALTQENLEYLRNLPRDVRLFPLPYGVGVKRDELRKRSSEYGRGLMKRAFFGAFYRQAPDRVRRILVLHGSPRALNERVTEDTAKSILEAISREAQTDLLVSAHAALSFVRKSAGMTFIGVGPLSGPNAVAGEGEYAVVDVREEPTAEFPRVVYDPTEHLQAIAMQGLPAALAGRAARDNGY